MKLTKELTGYFFGLFSVAIIITVMVTLALINPDYIIFYHIVSLLGVFTGKEIFNLFIIITGILQIPFFVILRNNLKKVQGIKSFVRNSALAVGIIFCLSEVGAGVFPIAANLIVAHATVAFYYFHSAIFTIFLFCILLLHDSNKRVPAYFGFIVVIIILNFQFWRGGFFEWIAILSIYFWIGITSLYCIEEFSKQSSNTP